MIERRPAQPSGPAQGAEADARRTPAPDAAVGGAPRWERSEGDALPDETSSDPESRGVLSQVGEGAARVVADADALPLAEIDPLLLGKVEEILEEVPDLDRDILLEPLVDRERTAEARRDALATRLMEVFRVHRSRAAFGLLYELYGPQLLQQVATRLRRYQSKADPHDVLQEVYVNIYRYPHRFDATRDDAFRLWTSTIVRNTVLKHLRSLSRSGRAEIGFDDLPEPPEPRANGPLQGAIRSEAERECARVYFTYLHLYLEFYRRLSAREQRAIHLVEVDGESYRSAAAELGIKLENLKMVIFRARRKIHRSMRRVFDGLPPDVRPARTPRERTAPGAGDSGGNGAVLRPKVTRAKVDQAVGTRAMKRKVKITEDATR